MLIFIIGLIPAALMRWVILRRPLPLGPTALISGVLLIGYVLLFDSMGWNTGTLPGAIAASSFFILWNDALPGWKRSRATGQPVSIVTAAPPASPGQEAKLRATQATLNKQQRIVSWVALGVFALSLLYAPWEMTLTTPAHSFGSITTAAKIYSRSVNAPLWNPPSDFSSRVSLRTGVLLLEWAALGVCYAAILFLLGDRTGESTHIIREATVPATTDTARPGRTPISQDVEPIKRVAHAPQLAKPERLPLPEPDSSLNEAVRKLEEREPNLRLDEAVRKLKEAESQMRGGGK